MLMREDRDYLMFIGELGPVRTDTLRKLFGNVSDRNTRNRRDRLVRDGYLVKEKIFGNQPVWVWSTDKGLEAVKLPYRAGISVPINDMRFGHQLAVTDLAVRLQERLGSGLRELKGKRSVEGQGQPYPDILCEMRFDGGWQQVVIEVELSKKQIDDKVGALKDRYPIVYYVVNEETKAWVISARERTGVDFDIYDLATLEVC